MTIQNKYVNADVVAGKKATAAFIHGTEDFFAVTTFEVAVADDDGSIYRVLKNVPQEYIPARIEIYNDAIAGGTDFDLGFYKSFDELAADGTVIDKEALAATLDMSAAALRGSPKEGLNAVDIADAQKRLYELAGDTLVPFTKEIGYDIAFTANTVGAAAGTITALFWFVRG